MTARTLLLIALFALCASAAPGLAAPALAAPQSKSRGKSRTKASTKRRSGSSAQPAKARPAKAQKRAGARTRGRARARARSGARGCRDIFCGGVRVVAIGKKEDQGLTWADVERQMAKIQGKLLPCAVQQRRRDPRLREAWIEFVVSRAGRVIATRVNGKRRSMLARCIHRQLQRLVRFARWRYRQVAEFRLSVAP